MKGAKGATEVADRYQVRATDYGFGVWDTRTADWWIPRLDMAERDAEQIVEDLNRSRSA